MPGLRHTVEQILAKLREAEAGRREFPENLARRVNLHTTLPIDLGQCCPQQSLYRSSGMFFIFRKTVSRSSALVN